MKFCYADPPYIGMARKHYGADAKEVNHELLIGYLCAEFDAWALSLSTPTLKRILATCPDDVRIGSWCKSFASFKPGVNPGYAWEPVIFRGGRKLGREVPTVRDFIVCPITLRRGVSGAKPEAFCNWIFEFIGLTPEDEFVDLFPGSGVVSRAWDKWKSQGRLVA